MAEDSGEKASSNRRDLIRLGLEVLGFVSVIATLGITSWLNIESLERATESIEESRLQMAEGQYQAVYEQQLELWKLAAENPDLAPYIVGGKKLADGAVGGRQAVDEGEAASREAAVIQALDFFAYVYEQLAPFTATGDRHPLAAAGAYSSPPAGIDAGRWDGWISWSNTIRSGFQGAPSMCDLLRNNAADYSVEFRRETLDRPDVCPAL